MPYIEYAINKDFISKVLCINKNTPELNCNGKCYLKSQLKKANETNQSDKPVVPPKIELGKYPIGFIQECVYSNKQVNLIKNTSFIVYFFRIKEHFTDVPTPPPKLFFSNYSDL